MLSTFSVEAVDELLSSVAFQLMTEVFFLALDRGSQFKKSVLKHAFVEEAGKFEVTYFAWGR